MIESKVRDIKKAQKERLLLREISTLFAQTARDDQRLVGLSINKVKLSPDKGMCYVYFYTPGGKEQFDHILEFLTLYKPSLRSALAKAIKGRYTPDLIFKFDDQFEKEDKLNHLLEKIKSEGHIE